MVLAWINHQCSFLSFSHFWCLLYRFMSHSFRIELLTLHNISTISSSSLFASNLGLFVIFLTTICFWWNRHICVGIDKNPHNNHLLQSQTIPVTSTQFACNSRIHCLYTSIVSWETLYHKRFFFMSRLLKTIYPYTLHQYVVSIIITDLHFGISFFIYSFIKPFLDSSYFDSKLFS